MEKDPALARSDGTHVRRFSITLSCWTLAWQSASQSVRITLAWTHTGKPLRRLAVVWILVLRSNATGDRQVRRSSGVLNAGSPSAGARMEWVAPTFSIAEKCYIQNAPCKESTRLRYGPEVLMIKQISNPDVLYSISRAIRGRRQRAKLANRDAHNDCVCPRSEPVTERFIFP